MCLRSSLRLEEEFRSVTGAPRQSPVVLLDQALEACWDIIRTGNEDPILPLSLQLSSQAELQLFQSLDDLRLDPVQLSQVQVDILTVQPPQGINNVAEFLLVQVHVLEEAL